MQVIVASALVVTVVLSASSFLLKPGEMLHVGHKLGANEVWRMVAREMPVEYTEFVVEDPLVASYACP